MNFEQRTAGVWINISPEAQKRAAEFAARRLAELDRRWYSFKKVAK